jgi:hypothetical protein
MNRDWRFRVNAIVGVSLSAMKRLLLFSVAMVACVSFSLAQEKSDVPNGWNRINICRISFYAPPDIKKSDMRGADSCVAQFANKDIALYLDYGVYGGPATALGSELEWKQESLSVGGKDAQLTTFVDARQSNSGLKFIAALYVVVKPVEPGREREWGPTTLRCRSTRIGERTAMRRWPSFGRFALNDTGA